MTRKQQIEGKARQRNPYVGGTKGDLCSALMEEFIAGAQWADKTMIDKAVEWLKNYRQYTHDGMGYTSGIVNDRTIDDFRKAMEE